MTIIESIQSLLGRRSQDSAGNIPRIKITGVPSIPAWSLQLLTGVLLFLGVWIATGWMLPTPASILLGLTAVLAGSNLVRVTFLTPMVMIAATLLFFIAPVGTDISWRSFALIGLSSVIFRLYTLLSLVARSTDIALSVVWRQTKIWAVLMGFAAAVLILLHLLSGTTTFTNVWLYLAALALAVLGTLSAISLYSVRRP